MAFALFQFTERLFRTATAAAQLVITRVDYDLGEPCLEGGRVRAVITAQCQINLGEALLNYFFNLFAVRKEASGDARCLTAMSLGQLFKGCFITRAGCSNQRVICRFFEWMHKCFCLIGPQNLDQPIRAFRTMSFSN